MKEQYQNLLSTLENAAKQAREIARKSPTTIHRALEEPIRECRGRLQRLEYAEERVRARQAAAKAEAEKNAAAHPEKPPGPANPPKPRKPAEVA